MKKYSIKEVEELTGIKAHTLRIWEKRYKLVPCERTQTNIRYYNDEELKRLINISQLLVKGKKISKIAKFSNKELQDEILKISNIQCDESILIDRLTTCMLSMDEYNFHCLLNKAIESFGFIHTVTNIIYPFLTKIGILWQTGNINPVQEHFISHLIRQKIMAETEKLPVLKTNNKTFLLFLPVNEMHELGLLFYNYYLRLQHYTVIYLGANVPVADVENVLQQYKIDYILTYFITCKPKSDIQLYLEKVEKVFRGKAIYAAGIQCGCLNCNDFKKLVKINSFEDLKEKTKR